MSCYSVTNRSCAEVKSHAGLIKWLSPVHPDEIHAKVSASRHPDTGLTFTAGPLLSWLARKPGHSSMMWITGKCKCEIGCCTRPTSIRRRMTAYRCLAGTGKTTLL